MIKQASRDFSLFLLKESKLHFCDQLEKLETKPVITATLFPRCLFPDAVWPAQHTGDEQRLKLDTSASICGIKWPEASFVWQSTTLIGKIKKSVPCAQSQYSCVHCWNPVKNDHLKFCTYNIGNKANVLRRWRHSHDHFPRQCWKLSRRRRIQPKVSAYQEWPQKQILKKSWIQPFWTFWTPSKDTSWGKDHDQDHLSHLTRIPNSKSSNWKGFKLKKMNSILQPCFCFWPRPLTLVPSLVKAKGKMYENHTGWPTSMTTLVPKHVRVPWCHSHKFQKKVWELPKKKVST